MTYSTGNAVEMQWRMNFRAIASTVVPMLVFDMRRHCCDVCCCGRIGVGIAGYVWSDGFLERVMFPDTCTAITKDSLL